MTPSPATHARIVTTGREILLEEGLRAVTTNEVAARAHISKKTLYKCFATKDELLEAIVISFIEENLAGLDRILDQEKLAIVLIREALGFVSQFMPRLQQHVISQIERIDPPLWSKIDQIRTARLKRLADLIPLAQADGHVRPDLDPDLWLLFFFGAVRSVLAPKTLIDAGYNLMQLIDTLELLYVDGILTPKGRAALADSSRRTPSARKDPS